MSAANEFTDHQKQYLAGFTYGADIARVLNNLPVVQNAGSLNVQGTAIQLSANGASINGRPLPQGVERKAAEAQSRVEATGGKLCTEELAKREKNGLDLWDEIALRSAKQQFPKGTDVFLQKFHGLFFVAPAQNSYMCRLRLPGGQLHHGQATGLADVADRLAGGYVDVTTRANLQLREIAAGNAIELLYGLRELDIINLGAGSDNIRNVTCSALSGIDPTELCETLPLAKRMHHFILNHREMFGLPRKFNIAFDGGGRISALEDTNDIGFRAVRVLEDQADSTLPAGIYFLLNLGGITGHQDFARSTNVLLRSDQVFAVAQAIIHVFIQQGDRTDRKKARLKYLLDRWGFEKFLCEIETAGKFSLLRVSSDRFVASDQEQRLAHVGFHRQRQPGLVYAGIVLPVGRLRSDQLRGLAAIAQQYGSGELRLTVWQNVILPNLREQDVEHVQQELLELGLDWRATSLRAGLVACTGSAGCKYAGADTKRDALRLAEYLQTRVTLDQPLNIHVTGCHHSCAQHYIGDIGLIACKVERGDDLIDGYHMHVGGGWGARQGIARELFTSLTADEVLPVAASLLEGYMQTRDADESFVAFARRKTDDELRSFAEPPLPRLCGGKGGGEGAEDRREEHR